ncbi:MAG: TRAM domain-containing protein, partial [Clostridia bacterium]|nr:TRAM domain-containing protein [Clostridia bacterium]
DVVNAQTRLHSQHFVGKVTEVLCEGYDEKRGLYLGRNEYGRMAYFSSGKDRVGDFLNVKVDKANGVSLFGDIQE